MYLVNKERVQIKIYFKIVPPLHFEKTNGVLVLCTWSITYIYMPLLEVVWQHGKVMHPAIKQTKNIYHIILWMSSVVNINIIIRNLVTVIYDTCLVKPRGQQSNMNMKKWAMVSAGLTFGIFWIWQRIMWSTGNMTFENLEARIHLR